MPTRVEQEPARGGLSRGIGTAGRAGIDARTMRSDRWWRYPLATFTVLFCFIVYATYAALANRDYYADPYLSPFYSPCLATVAAQCRIHATCRI